MGSRSFIPRWTRVVLAFVLTLASPAESYPEPGRGTLRTEQLKNNPAATAGLEEGLAGGSGGVSPVFLAYEQRLAEQIQADGVFQMELDGRGFLRKLTLRGAEVLYDAEQQVFSWPGAVMTVGEIMPFRPLAYTVEDGLLAVHEGLEAFSHFHPDASRRTLELKVDVGVKENDRELLRELMDSLAVASGASKIDFLKPMTPGAGEILEPRVQIALADGQGRWRIVEGERGWIISKLPPAAGLEEEVLNITIREFLGKRERERKFRVPAWGLIGAQPLNFRQLFALLVQNGLLDYTHHLNIERELVFIERRVRARAGWDSVVKILGSPATNEQTNRLDPFAEVHDGDRVTLTSKVLASRKAREDRPKERESSLAPTTVKRRGDVVEVRLLDAADLELLRDREQERPAPVGPPSVSEKGAAARRVRALFRAVPVGREVAVGIGPTLAGEHARTLHALAPLMPPALRRQVFVITADATVGQELAARGLNASSEPIVVVEKLKRRFTRGRVTLYYQSSSPEFDALKEVIQLMGVRSQFEAVQRNSASEIDSFLQELLASLLRVHYGSVRERVDIQRLVRDVELLTRA